VLLGPGTFTCSETIAISTNGVVLRGSGSGPGGTTIKMVGSRHAAIMIGNRRVRGARGGGPTINDDEPAASPEQAAQPEFTAAQTTIADAYVPSGTTTFTVADAAGFAVGDTIEIRRPTAPAWVKLMQMDTLRRTGRPQTWLGRGRDGVAERKITAMTGNKFTVDIPLADSYDATYLNPPGTTVTRTRPSTTLTQVGVEHLHLQCPPLEIAYGRAPYSALRINGEDCWVKDLYCEETMNSTALRGKRITLQRVVVKHTYPNLGASKPTDFSIEGSQMLLDRCRITGDNMYFVWTGSLEPGPNVLLNCTFNGRGSRIQPHMRWSTGLLVDNCRTPDGGIDFMNRGVAGSGHGWTMGWAVAWNCVADTYIIQDPPGAANWAIGCIGRRWITGRMFNAEPLLPEGIFDSHGIPVAPRSLYLAQVAERLGPQALRNIGYPANNDSAFAEKVGRLPVLPSDTDKILGPNLALRRPVNAGNVRDRDPAYSGEKALDGDDRTYWATSDGASRATLEVDMEGPVEINAAVIGEAAGLDQRVQEYRIEGMANSDWTLLAHGTSIGERKVDRFPNITVWKVRLTILKADPSPAIRAFGLYLAQDP
jgi:F5/8 type C domain